MIKFGRVFLHCTCALCEGDKLLSSYACHICPSVVDLNSSPILYLRHLKGLDHLIDQVPPCLCTQLEKISGISNFLLV